MKNVNLTGFAALFLSATLTFAAVGDLRLIDAVKKSEVPTVKSLLAAKVDVNATDVDGSTALHWAAQRDNLELVNVLLAAGANPKASTRYKITPMYFAAMNGNAAMIVTGCAKSRNMSALVNASGKIASAPACK